MTVDGNSGSPGIVVRVAVPGDEDALALVGAAAFLETFAGVLDEHLAHEVHARPVFLRQIGEHGKLHERPPPRTRRS